MNRPILFGRVPDLRVYAPLWILRTLDALKLGFTVPGMENGKGDKLERALQSESTTSLDANQNTHTLAVNQILASESPTGGVVLSTSNGCEVLDVFHDDGSVAGFVATREATHQEGLWHQTFHCWVVVPSEHGNAVVVAERSLEKATFPGMLDASCAGHLLQGESVQDGVRELHEELGICVRFEDLQSVGTLPVKNHWPLTGEPQFVVREHTHTFLLPDDRILTDFRFERSEISALLQIPVARFVSLLRGDVSSVRGWRSNGRTICGVEVEASSFVPAGAEYWEPVLEALANIPPLVSEAASEVINEDERNL